MKAGIGQLLWTFGILVALTARAEDGPRLEGKMIDPTTRQIQTFFETVQKREPTQAELRKTERFFRENPLPPAGKPLMRERAIDKFFEKVLGRDPTFSEMDSTLKFLEAQEAMKAAKDRQRTGGKSSDPRPGPGGPGTGGPFGPKSARGPQDSDLFDKAQIEFLPILIGSGGGRGGGSGAGRGSVHGASGGGGGGSDGGSDDETPSGGEAARSGGAGPPGTGEDDPATNVALARQMLIERVREGSLTPEEASSILQQIAPLLNRVEPGTEPPAGAAQGPQAGEIPPAQSGAESSAGGSGGVAAASQGAGPVASPAEGGGKSKLQGADAGTLLPSESAPEGATLEERLNRWSATLPKAPSVLSPAAAAPSEKPGGEKQAPDGKKIVAGATTFGGKGGDDDVQTKSTIGPWTSATAGFVGGSSSSLSPIVTAKKAKQKAEQWIGGLVARLAAAKAAKRLPASGADRIAPATRALFAGTFPGPPTRPARTGGSLVPSPDEMGVTTSPAVGWDAIDALFASAMALVALRLAWLLRRRNVAPTRRR